MADEYFFAITLKGKSTEVWDPDAKGTEEYQGGHKLIIKQAVLGPDATEGEVNVIEVKAMTWKSSVKIPVATLTAGGPNSQVLLDLSFPDPPVTFSLTQGNGPVYIIGHHLIGSPMDDYDDMDELNDDEMDEDCEEDVEEDEEEDVKPKKAKGKASAKKNSKVTVKKEK